MISKLRDVLAWEEMPVSGLQQTCRHWAQSFNGGRRPADMHVSTRARESERAGGISIVCLLHPTRPTGESALAAFSTNMIDWAPPLLTLARERERERLRARQPFQYIFNIGPYISWLCTVRASECAVRKTKSLRVRHGNHDSLNCGSFRTQPSGCSQLRYDSAS